MAPQSTGIAAPWNAEAIAKALGGRRTGSEWVAHCPTHNDHNPSLSIRDGKGGRVLVHCHAGCEQTTVLAALKLRGAWKRGLRPDNARLHLRGPADLNVNRDNAKYSAAASAIWAAAVPAPGTPVETYLQSRALRLPPPPTLRFHPNLRHPSGDRWPAMVALVTSGADRTPLGIHRTFLAADGYGKAPISPAKMMLGPVRGGAVRLGPPAEVLMVGEGVETCLAGMLAWGWPAWAALSTRGLGALDLPIAIREVIVLADGDGPGEQAARDCARRWRSQGRRVWIARPPWGMDFNDMLVAREGPFEKISPC